MPHQSPAVPVAVIGLACWYPDARTPRQLWENVLARRRAFRQLPPGRLPIADYVDPQGHRPDTTYARRAAVIDGFDFDWAARRIPKTTVQSTDVVHWLALETALSAIQDAGFDPEDIPGEATGVIVGNTLTGEQTRSATLRLRWPYVRRALHHAASQASLDRRQLEALETAMQARYKAAFPPITEDTLAGGLANTIAGRICYHLNLQGGGYIVDGACSSSLLAMASGMARLVSGDLDLAIIGGVDISLDPFELVGFAKTRALSPGDMHVYDVRGQGFIPGEGCGFVVLKRGDDARRDGDTIYAVIDGWGISSDGRGAGITAPSVRGQVLALQRAFARTPFGPQALDFIEGHGTGTTVGDPIELTAIHTVLSGQNGSRKRYCGVTSLKSIIGHTKAASGIGGLIKTVMALNRRVIPPLAGCEQPHPIFEEKLVTIYPVLHGRCCAADKVLHAGVSSMGFGGINCHITLRSGDHPSSRLASSIDEDALLVSHQSSEVFVLSSASAVEMAARAREWAAVAAGISMAELTDFALHMAQSISGTAPWRAALVAADPDTLARSLVTLAEHMDKGGKLADTGDQMVWMARPGAPPRFGMLFPGQGSQQINMARALIQRFEWGRKMLSQAQKEVGEIEGLNLGQWILRDPERAENANQVARWGHGLARTRIAQPAICLASALWLTFLDTLGIHPTAVGGHSLGEVTALYGAGAMDLKTLLAFAALRGHLMDQSADGAMAALGCDSHQASEIIDQVPGYVTIANLNAPAQTVVSGESASVEAVVQLAQTQKIAARRLSVSGGFHSRLMADAAAKIKRAACLPRTITQLTSNVFSTVEGRQLKIGEDLLDHLSRQVVSPVDFSTMVQSLSAQVDLILEVGPGRVLSGLTLANLPHRRDTCLPVEAVAEEWDSLNQLLAVAFVSGADIRWPALYRNRLVRPFIQPQDKNFITNICETPVDPQQADGRQTVSSTAPSLVRELSDLAGLQPAEISNYLQHRGRFLARVIRADMDIPAEPMSSPPSGPEVEVLSQSPSVSQHSAAKRALSNGDLSKRMLALIEEKTGFDPKTISPQFRLLDDLNLDSIKAGDLLVRMARLAGVQWPDNPSVMANARLVEIEAALKQLQTQQVGSPVQALEGDSEPDHDGSSYLPAPSWVRNFRIKWVQTPLQDSSRDAFGHQDRVLVLHEPAAAFLAKALENSIKTMAGDVSCQTFQGALEARSGGLEAFTHRIAIMPTTRIAMIDLGADLAQIVAYRALLTQSISDVTSFTAFVQFGRGRFGRTRDSANLSATGCAALAAGLHHEYPRQRICVVDLPERWPTADAVRTLLAEIKAVSGFSAAGYDSHGQRWIWQPAVSAPAAYQPRQIRYHHNDVILVSGGAKGITAECARTAAKATGAQLALLGSSTLQSEGEIDSCLKRLASEGLRARYYRCDITDTRDVSDTVAVIRREQGPIRAVIHGAGLNRPRPAKTVTAQEALAEIGPKVLGFINLWTALRDTPPELVVGLSSVIGLTGMPGNAWYGFANEALDILFQAVEVQCPATRTQSVAYSIWRDTGMGARMGSVTRLAQMGIEAIPSEEGCRRFGRLFTHDPQTPVVIVTARLGGLDTWHSPLPSKGALSSKGRFCRQPVLLTPGIEAVFRVRLDLKSDLYLQDHRFQDSYLFPTVFGLEAMTQAALVAADADEATRIRLEDVLLERPITVDAKEGAELTVWAQMVESEGKSPYLRIKAGIRKENAGLPGDYFSATVVLNPPEQTIEPARIPNLPALAIDPQEDLYRPTLLFQGPRFQRIDQVFVLEGNNRDQGRALLSAHSVDGAAAAEAAFAEHLSQSMVLPDPFFSDALLQSPALLVPQDTALPVAIDVIDFFPDARSATGPMVIQADLEKCVDRTFHTQVLALNPAGSPVMRLTGYRLKILKHMETYPTVDDLRDPCRRDRQVVAEALERSAIHLHVALPEIDLSYVPGIHDMDKATRHQAESALLSGLMAYGAARWSFSPEKCTVTWSSTGKPILAGNGVEYLDVSLTHDRRLCLAVLGSGSQGCDIAPITPRNRQEWMDLLGQNTAQLLDRLTGAGDNLDQAGTRLWSAREAALKSWGRHTRIRLDVVQRADQAVLLQAEGDHHHTLLVLTQPLHLTWGGPKILALVVDQIQAPSQAKAQGPSAATYPSSYSGLCQRPAYEILPTGPGGELIFVQRFPVTFKPSAQLSRYVYFTHFFDWMGHAREASTWPIMHDLISLLSTGQWGSVTNYSRLKICGEVRTGDLVQLRMWTADNSGPQNGTMTLQYEFVHCLPDGDRRLLALSELQTTWVALTGPGQAVPAPYPAVLQEFFNDMIPKGRPLQPELSLPGTLKGWHDAIEPALYQAAAGPVIHPQLAVDTFETSLGQANAVGNVYYANYYEWQGALRDHYLQRLLPEYFGGVGQMGEAICLDCRVDHLREAMPFDRIMVTMALKSLNTSRAKLYFDYYRVDGSGPPIKLAWGTHLMVWVRRDNQGRPLETDFPPALRKALETAIENDPESSPLTITSPAPIDARLKVSAG